MAAEGSGLTVRRAEVEDEASVASLVADDAIVLKSRYGVENLGYLIENALLSLTVLDMNGNVCAFAAFTDYPGLAVAEAVTSGPEWETWFGRVFGQPEINVHNSMWLAYFVADVSVEPAAGDLVLRTLFTTLTDVAHCLVLTRYQQMPFYPFEKMAEEVPASDKAGEDGAVYSVFDIRSSYFVAPVKIRTARVEDHDDLVPIFNSQSEVLTERYGEFFLASLIESQDEENRALVAEVNGRAVGLMALTSQLDVQLLQQGFVLEPYDSLVKLTEAQREEALAAFRDRAERRRRRRERLAAKAARLAALEKAAQEKLAADRSARSSRSGKGEEASAAAPADAAPAPAEAHPEGAPAAEGDGAEAVAAEEEEEEEAEAELERSLGVSAQGVTFEDPTVHVVLGEGNAFRVTLFCIDARYESRSAEFIQAAFGLYGGRDYMVLTLPHASAEFPLLLHLDPVEPRVSSTFAHVLYLASRQALRPMEEVRQAAAADIEGVRRLALGLDDEEREAVEGAVEGAVGQAGGARTAWLGLSRGQVVALAVLDAEAGRDVEELKGRYELQRFIDFRQYVAANHAYLASSLFNPLFSGPAHSRAFFKEIFRKSRKSALYYKEHPGATNPSVLPQLIQVRPRRQVQVPGQAEGEAFALHFLTRKMVTERKTAVNARLVVVGASDTGVSFLESLSFVPYLRFTSLTLVSRAGSRGPAPGEPSFVSTSHCFTRLEYAQLALESKVRVFDGKVVDMDRGRRTLALSSGFLLPYDYLVVTTGLQDQSLARLAPEAGAGAMRGVFSLSNERSVRALREHLPAHFLRGWGMAVVYGATLSAYCAVEGLMASGVAPSRIVLVRPPRPADQRASCFNNPRVEAQVAAALEGEGIQVHDNFTLANVEGGEDGALSALVLRAAPPEGSPPDAEGEMQWVACRLLVCCDTPDVDPDIFAALNENSLVYDGRLVVTHKFLTNDPAIFAAGPGVKFARKYRAKHPLQYANSRHVGTHLAGIVLSLLDPESGEEGAPPAPLSEASAVVTGDEFMELPVFSEPKASGGVLPGALHYFHFESPERPRPLVEAQADKSYGRDLVTDVDGVDYFRMHVDQYGCVESITYTGREPVEFQNLLSLYGIPAGYLNRVEQRYDEGLIPDFIHFLRETWSFGQYHDRWGEFRRRVQEELAAEPDMHALRKDVAAELDAAGHLSAQRRADFTASLPKASRKVVEEALLRHLRQNAKHLSMYLIPGDPSNITGP
eukprot:tig00021464_g21716.t1